ncbi:energy transducer TonB [Pleionea sediminis]|uniref:energy transducer TonB n=1 Tax=Pleionea sediminis TaxID=2569479 RepID=UPI0013DE1170|nr:energy transducer TonB [Pleionea sediminis]
MSAIFSLGTVIGLLILMSNMVSAKHSTGSLPVNPVYNGVEVDFDLLKKIRKPEDLKPVVEKPKAPETTQKPKQSNPVTAEPLITSSPTSTFSVGLPDISTEPMKDIGNSWGLSGSEATPRLRIEPLYPREAQLKGLEGYVSLLFDIDESGAVTNIRVLESEPQRLFDKAAVNALRKWKYNAKKENGKTIKLTNQQVTLQFEMES